MAGLMTELSQTRVQVPFSCFALLGSGRLASHLKFYFQSLNLPLNLWSRDGQPAFNTERLSLHHTERLQRVVERSSHILFAVRDDAIESLSAPLVDPAKQLVHFSGARYFANVAAAHPLMTFSKTLETLDWYIQIPFVLDAGFRLPQLLPGLTNRAWSLDGSQRPLYHALCALAGNSTYLLWSQIGDEFEKGLGMPRGLLSPFLHQVVTNAERGQASGFTGPVARGDWQTVRHHLDALNVRPDLHEAYQNFLKLARYAGHSLPEVL